MSLPPLQPTYILRGHASQIHATTFIRHNTRLLTGDADGWVVLWDLSTKRPTAVWRAHQGTILGLEEWGDGRVITHGKDNKLIVWKLSEEDEKDLSTVLPIDEVTSPRRQPWLLHVLDVNTLNFCAFAHCIAQGNEVSSADKEQNADELLVAVPNAISSESLDIFHLPSTNRLYTFPSNPGILSSKTATELTSAKTGMIMAASIFYSPPPPPAGNSPSSPNLLTIAIGFESGHVALAQLLPQNENKGQWTVLYTVQTHSQPVLGLDVDPVGKNWLLSSAADAKIAKHPIITSEQQQLNHPQNAKFTVPQSNEPPLPSFMNSRPSNNKSQKPPPQQRNPPSLLSKALAQEPDSTSIPHPTTTPPSSEESTPQHPSIKTQTQPQPLQTVSTGHSGQQSLTLRNDSKIFATAGWDARIRVYSSKTLTELAVLKWHGVGVYAVGFADVDIDVNEGRGGVDVDGETAATRSREIDDDGKSNTNELALQPKLRDMASLSLSTVRTRRAQKARTTHWLAAGGKDGKVSLWEVY